MSSYPFRIQPWLHGFIKSEEYRCRPLRRTVHGILIDQEPDQSMKEDCNFSDFTLFRFSSLYCTLCSFCLLFYFSDFNVIEILIHSLLFRFLFFFFFPFRTFVFSTYLVQRLECSAHVATIKWNLPGTFLLCIGKVVKKFSSSTFSIIWNHFSILIASLQSWVPSQSVRDLHYSIQVSLIFLCLAFVRPGTTV